MHAPTFPLCVPVLKAEKLRQHLLNAPAPDQRDAVAPVASDPAVLLSEGVVDAGGDGLLTVVEVAETADGAGLRGG